MASATLPTPVHAFDAALSAADQASLLNGEILLQTRSHTLIGAGVTAQMFLPTSRQQAWTLSLIHI